MKIIVEINCTPAEARQFFGQPDLQPMQDRMMGEMERRLRVALLNVSADSVVQHWLNVAKPQHKKNN